MRAPFPGALEITFLMSHLSELDHMLLNQSQLKAGELLYGLRAVVQNWGQFCLPALQGQCLKAFSVVITGRVHGGIVMVS